MEQDTKLTETTPTELFTIEEVADKLKISRQTLWRLTKEKGVKTVKVGNSIRYTNYSIAQLIDN